MKQTGAVRKSVGAGRIAAVVFALVYPTLFTWVYFLRMDGVSQAAQQAVFFVGKAVQFGFPLVWLLLAERGRFRWKGPTRIGLAWGLVSGLVIGGATMGLYFGWLRSSPLFVTSAAVVREKLFGIGLTSPAAIIAMSFFYSLLHSLLEEYYWRWFVFGRLRGLMPLGGAIAISSLGFMAHHTILVFHYFSWPWATIASAAVAIGGALWAWRCERDGSLWGVWISHMLVNAAIFAIGYQMAFATSGH